LVETLWRQYPVLATGDALVGATPLSPLRSSCCFSGNTFTIKSVAACAVFHWADLPFVT
jgi:hypothetical protein